MEEPILKITGIRKQLDATAEQILAIKEELIQKNSSEMVLVRPADSSRHVEGIFLNSLRTPLLCGNEYVQESRQDGLLFIIRLRRAFLHPMLRLLNEHLPDGAIPAVSQELKPGSSLEELLDAMQLHSDSLSHEPKQQNAPGEFASSHRNRPAPPDRRSLLLDFVNSATPAKIERELNSRVIGQPQLTQAVADFLYYHALRQLNPELPMRPLIIAGPSGSGKTEVWRAAEALYGFFFRIKVIDSSRLTSDGWKGDYKLCRLIDSSLQEGGILIADEFDKLVRPKFGGGNMNVSLDIQSEFLKLLEGEAQFTDGKSKSQTVVTKKMGFVFIGSFEELRENMEQEYRERSKTIGFAPDPEEPEPFTDEISDEDYIDYGMLPEIVGRIASKSFTDPLTDEEYIQIINSPFSRVSTLRRVFEMYGTVVPEIPDSRIRELIGTATELKTGVRWVSAQIENEIIASIREKGLRAEA